MTEERIHASDCDWHVDQYPWECTCGAIPRKAAMDELIAADADLAIGNDKPTITDEDRAAAEDALFELRGFRTRIASDKHSMVQAFARHRQAAFNAGLERAVELVVGYIHPDPDRLPGELFASAAIRAEKEKPQ